MIEFERVYSPEQPIELRTVAVTVDIPSEFQALLSGLSSDGGRDQNGKITKLWKISGIQSVNFAHSEPGKTMVYNLDGTVNENEVYSELTNWLVDLRVRRQFTEQLIARSIIKS